MSTRAAVSVTRNHATHEAITVRRESSTCQNTSRQKKVVNY